MRQVSGVHRGYATKLCPRCGSELYDDMAVCYGCLYDFSRDPSHGAGELVPGAPAGLSGGGQGDTVDLSRSAAPVPVPPERTGVFVRTASVDVWVPVGEEGATLGRDPANDVVLHSPAVSRRHLRLAPVPEGMEVSDLGSTNPATYRGREVDRVVVPYGDAVGVCGCLLVMTGPVAGRGCVEEPAAL